jgi:hypothetical protein
MPGLAGRCATGAEAPGGGAAEAGEYSDCACCAGAMQGISASAQTAGVHRDMDRIIALIFTDFTSLNSDVETFIRAPVN